MKAARSMIALRSERVEQLKAMAALHNMPATMYLEELVRKQARRDEVPLPGLIVARSEDGRRVLFGFEVSKEGEHVPLTHLTPEEARQLAKCLKGATQRPRRLLEPVEAEYEGVVLEVGSQSVAITLDAHLRGGNSYRKTISVSMAVDVMDWLRQAAADVESSDQ